MPDLRTRAATALRIAGPDAVLTGHTSLALYGCRAADQGTVHVLVPDRRRIRSRPGIAVHHGAFAHANVETLRELRVLALEHALAEVLCRDGPATALECFTEVLETRPVHHRGRLAERIALAIRARTDPRGRTQALHLLRGFYGLVG